MLGSVWRVSLGTHTAGQEAVSRGTLWVTFLIRLLGGGGGRSGALLCGRGCAPVAAGVCTSAVVPILGVCPFLLTRFHSLWIA